MQKSEIAQKYFVMGATVLRIEVNLCRYSKNFLRTSYDQLWVILYFHCDDRNFLIEPIVTNADNFHKMVATGFENIIPNLFLYQMLDLKI